MLPFLKKQSKGDLHVLVHKAEGGPYVPGAVPEDGPDELEVMGQDLCHAIRMGDGKLAVQILKDLFCKLDQESQEESPSDGGYELPSLGDE